jgi:hypothetical protein
LETSVRNAQKTAVMAMFAAMETAKDEPKRPEPQLLGKPSPRDIQLDPLWLISRGAKGRA